MRSHLESRFVDLKTFLAMWEKERDVSKSVSVNFGETVVVVRCFLRTPKGNESADELAYKKFKYL